MPTAFPPLIGLLGYGPATARALRDLGYLALPLPPDDLSDVLTACQTLRISGVLVQPAYEEHAFAATRPDEAARQAGRVDAVALPVGLLAAEPQGTYTLPDALGDAVAAAHYAARGASALLIGHGNDLTSVMNLTRLGFTQVGFATDNPAVAKRLSREVPAGIASYALSRRDPALQTLAERADLIVVTGGSLPAGVLQPYHTLLDLSGRLPSGNASRLELSELPSLRLSQALLHITGQRLHSQSLSSLITAMTAEGQ